MFAISPLKKTTLVSAKILKSWRLLRSFALNLCRVNGANNIAATLYENALDLNQLLSWNFIT